MSTTIDTGWFQGLIKDKGYSQRGFAKLIEMDHAALSLMLNGKRKMSVGEAGTLAQHLGVPVTEVLRRAGVSGPARRAEVADGHRADPEVLRALADEIEETIAEIKGGTVSRPVATSALGLLILSKKDLILAALRASQNDGAAASEWRPELVGADRLGKDRKGDVTINVPTALCWLQFRPGCSTGTDEQTRPGVGFSLVAYPDSHGEWPSGVIPRDEATKLHDMLGRFLAQPDPSQEPGTGGER